MPRASDCSASRLGGNSNNPPLYSLPPPVLKSIASPGDSCFPVSFPRAPPFSTPLEAWRSHCSPSSWSPAFPSLNSTCPYAGLQTDLYDTPSYPSGPQFPLSKSPQFPTPNPTHLQTPSQRDWCSMTSPALSLSSYQASPSPSLTPHLPPETLPILQGSAPVAVGPLWSLLPRPPLCTKIRHSSSWSMSLLQVEVEL